MLLLVLLAIAGTVMVSREALSAERPVFSTAAVGRQVLLTYSPDPRN